jgi:hypothetical protein
MLRRYDPSLGGIGEALRELTLEHERLTAEARRVTSEELAEHLRLAGELLASGKVSEAWGHACDALQLDSTDRKAIALEARVRKALEAQAARDLAREQENARRAQEARTRELQRASALTRGPAVETAIDAGELNRVEPVIEPVVERVRQHEPVSEPIASQPAVSVVAAIGQPRALWAAAVVLVVAAAALWLVPIALKKPAPPAASSSPASSQPARPQPPPTAAEAAPPPTVATNTPAPSGTATARPEPAAVEPAAVEPAAVERVAVKPAAVEPAKPTAAPEPPAEPPAATTGMGTPTPSVPDETAVANFREHVQTLLVKKDTDRALSVLSDALAYAPADQGLRALAPKVLDQARTAATQERSRALARRASAQPKFKEAEQTMQRAQRLARERKTEASAEAYLDAADLFAGAAAGAASRGDEDVAVPEAAQPEPEAPAGPPPPKFEPPPARPKPTLAMVDPVIDAFASAMSRGDRGALHAVYPKPPAEVLAALVKRPRGYNMRIDDRFMISDSRGRPEIVLSVVHESISASGAREERPQRLIVTLDYVEKAWQIVASR